MEEGEKYCHKKVVGWMSTRPAEVEMGRIAEVTKQKAEAGRVLYPVLTKGKLYARKM